MRVSDVQRRAWVVARHHLDRTAADANSTARALVAMHATDPATPYLSLHARLADASRRVGVIEELDGALHVARTLWRMHAMRRTLFLVPVETVATVQVAIGRDVAARERSKLAGWIAASQPGEDAEATLQDASARLLAALEHAGDARAAELAASDPVLGRRITVGSGRWSAEATLASRLLLVLAAEGRVVRTRAVGSWRSGQFRWSSAAHWSDGAPPAAPGPEAAGDDEDGADARLAERYLASFGPATTDDLKWWTGWPVRRTAAALSLLSLVDVEFDGGARGHLLARDADELAACHGSETSDQPAVALLPALDATPMGWCHRDWFLGGHRDALFDRNGNIGPTIWVDGRVAGGWAQSDDGRVVTRLLEDVGGAAAVVDERAEELSGLLAGDVVVPRFRTPLERELAAG